MKQYLLLKKIKVESANAIAGITYGFPPITGFLGFAHAMSRSLPVELGISLGGVGILSHKAEVYAESLTGGDKHLALTRNPLRGKKGIPASFIEEGRMHLTVSLLIEVDGLIGGKQEQEDGLYKAVQSFMIRARVAGGTVWGAEEVSLTNVGDDTIVSRLMPASVLIERSELLESKNNELKVKNPNSTTLDALLHYSETELEATPIIGNSDGKFRWVQKKRDEKGYLVPLATGYKNIAPIYSPDQIEGSRDKECPVAFVEQVHTIGEWLSAHRVNSVSDIIWRYEQSGDWYLAKNNKKTNITPESALEIDFDEEIEF